MWGQKKGKRVHNFQGMAGTATFFRDWEEERGRTVAVAQLILAGSKDKKSSAARILVKTSL